jgi:hypothetical protein
MHIIPFSVTGATLSSLISSNLDICTQYLKLVYISHSLSLSPSRKGKKDLIPTLSTSPIIKKRKGNIKLFNHKTMSAVAL